MIAKYRVKDINQKTIGFVLDDNKFYHITFISNNINVIDNLRLLSNGVLRSKTELPIIYYKDIMKLEYSKLVKNNPFNRDIQAEFKYWKDWSNHKVLQLQYR